MHTVDPRHMLCLVSVFLFGAASAAADATFPRPPGLEPDVRFWIRIYSEVDTNGGLIHDSRDLRVVYDKVGFSSGESRRSRQRQVESRKKQIGVALRRLAKGKRTGLSKEEKRILALFPDGVSNKTLSAATKQVRFQLGQADKFRAGIVRSGAWRDFIRETFREMGLPTGLAALPHVESSFTPTAYSRVGAAGLWQFIRSTGRRFMRVDHVVDERRDPYTATRAAAQLLSANKHITGTWPLALTAYNHGAAGMRRAVRKMGTSDIEKIVRRYESRTFGFASRNFYVEFLAARQVETNSTHYFGELALNPPIPHESIELPFYARAGELAGALGISRDQLKQANPALSKSVWSESKFIPRGYTLRVRVADLPRPLAASIETMQSKQQYATQTPDRTHRVRRGDTLSGIAARYGTTARRLGSLNKLRSRNRIRVGQVLRLPGSGAPARAVARQDVPASGVYKVRRGDSVSRIASQFGMSERQLLAMNQLRNRNRIYPGQSLRVAAKSPPASVAEAADRATVAKVPAEAAPAAEPATPDAGASEASEPAESAELAESADPAEETADVPVAEAAVAVAEEPVEESEGPVAVADEPAAAQPVADEPVADEPVAAEPVAAEPVSQEPEAEETAPEEPAEELAEEPAPAANMALTDVDPPFDEPTPIELAALREAALEAPKETSNPEAADSELADSEPADAEAADEATVADGPEDASELARDLQADPADYSVAEDGSIEIQPAETLGHIAEWLDVRASQLRTLNRMRYGRSLDLHRRLELDFTRVDREEFERRRLEHHRALQTEFFERFEIAGTRVHVIRRGDSIWNLSRSSGVPFWLLHQYNPDVDMSALRAGAKLTVPEVRRHGDS